MIRLRFGTFLRLSILGIAINFPFLIKNLVFSHLLPNKTLGLNVQDTFSDKEGNFLYQSRYSECDPPFPILDVRSQM